MTDFIGVFDSGIGGLTVFSAIKEAFKNENIVYLADTKNCPYGVKSMSEVREITLKNISYLKALGAKVIIIACNTATSTIIDVIENSNNYIIGVIQPTALEALNQSKTKKIGLFATNLTVASHIYDQYLQKATLYSEGCSDFVMLIEKGEFHSKRMKELIKNHVNHIGEVDTLILGCTHFPYIKDEIQEILPGVQMIESGKATTNYLKRYLTSLEKNTKRKLFFLTTGDLTTSQKQITMLNLTFDEVKKVEI